MKKKVVNITQPTEKDKEAVKFFVRMREDFQAMRKRIDNRMGKKADGTDQNIEERSFRIEDLEMFANIRQAAHDQENQIEKNLKKALQRFPIYRNWLVDVKGVGAIAAGWIISEYDIHEATTVSKLWQFTGLNPGLVVGKKRIENKEDGTFSYIPTDKMIRGDKLTAGFVAPFNKRLRTAMVGVMADGFIKAQNEYALNYYYPYKMRLEQEQNEVEEIPKAGAKPQMLAWKDTKKAHRDRAAKRYMVKMFLKDLYVAWRTIEGLPVREPYMSEYLGKAHEA